MTGFPDQPGGVSQRPDRNRSIIGCHAAKLILDDEGSLGAQVRRAECGEYTRRTSANNNNVQIDDPRSGALQPALGMNSNSNSNLFSATRLWALCPMLLACCVNKTIRYRVTHTE